MRIIIVGAGGHGKVILDILSYLSDFEVVGFIDDNPKVIGSSINGKSVLGSSEDIKKLQKQFNIDSAVIAIGNNNIRASLFEKFVKGGFKMPRIIHPRSIISSNVKMGDGVVIMPGAIINTGTQIGDDACINTGATVDHDCFISNHAHIFPGANLAGGVQIGKFSYIGTNAAVNPYLKIGENTMIGTGAAVADNIPDNVVAVGVPAKIIKNQK